MTAPAMPPETAAWIREHAWPAWMRAMDDDYEHGCFLFRMCACQLGVCVPCSKDGEHDKCLTRQRDGRPLGWDMAVWAWTSGRLPVHGRGVADVTVTGRSCRWTCLCGCWRADEPGDAAARAAPAEPEPDTAEPAGPPPFTAERAAWIRDNVIPKPVRDGRGPDGCPCDWSGPSSHCENDDHHRCHGEPIVYPDGWVTWPDGHVCTPAPATDVQVWCTGRPCTYRCTCACHHTWWLDRPGNVIHRGNCPNREGAKHWRNANGKDWSAVTDLMAGTTLCPAPCVRGLRCADFDFGPTATQPPKPVQLDIFAEAT